MVSIAHPSPDVHVLRKRLRRIYRNAGPVTRLLVEFRPFICPFDVIVDAVPAGRTVLDVGCGTGVFLNLLAESGKLGEGTGFDANPMAVRQAEEGAATLADDQRPRYLHVPIGADWPDGAYHVVSMIDVLHHVAPGQQQEVIGLAASRVERGGMFLYKDIATRPLWRAWANRMHDLALAQQWIHYVPVPQVVAWAAERGLVLERQDRINLLWYGHDLLIFRRS